MNGFDSRGQKISYDLIDRQTLFNQVRMKKKETEITETTLIEAEKKDVTPLRCLVGSVMAGVVMASRCRGAPMCRPGVDWSTLGLPPGGGGGSAQPWPAPCVRMCGFLPYSGQIHAFFF